VLLHRKVNVLVPAPERYAVRKLIVSSRRLTNTLGRVKADKDLSQAALLFEGLVETPRSDAIAIAWDEAWERGDAWRDAITKASRAPPKGVKALGQATGPSIVEELLTKATDR
jgi:hypothetical protein